MNDHELYLVPEDLFRLGNSEEPRLTHLRSQDVTLTEINGVQMVVSNGQGISLFTREELAKRPMVGWVWRIAARTPLPQGLRLIADYPGHYLLAPAYTMPVSNYKRLLEQVALRATREYKKEIRRA